LIFNCGEAGFQEWADRRDIVVASPDCHEGDPTNVSRIRADGSILKSTLAISRTTPKSRCMELVPCLRTFFSDSRSVVS
jgi:hypothetical protein